MTEQSLRRSVHTSKSIGRLGLAGILWIKKNSTHPDHNETRYLDSMFP